jgi:ribosomal protein S27E
MDLDLDPKDTCYDCGSHNFNIWGTVISGHLNIEVRCMSCGEILKKCT